MSLAMSQEKTTSQEIDWPPTPPNSDGCQSTEEVREEAKPALTGREIRLRDIERALAKRAADDQIDAPTKKQRTAAAACNPAPAPIASLFLNAEQNQILKLVEEGQSVFYTGSAGTSVQIRPRRAL